MSLRVKGLYEYETIEGDMFDHLAFRFYNNEKMSHHIIQANPIYSDVVVFDAGIILWIPIFDNNKPLNTLPPWRR